MDIEKYIQYIKDCHERTVISGKKVCHDGDCGIYKLNIPVCTCGLLHKLLPFAVSYYDEVIKLYPKYEKDLEKQEIWEALTYDCIDKDEFSKAINSLLGPKISQEEAEALVEELFTEENGGK